MKKGFGIFFIVVGVLNFITPILTMIFSPNTAQQYAPQVGQRLFMGIGFMGLGYWMYTTSKSTN